MKNYRVTVKNVFDFLQLVLGLNAGTKELESVLFPITAAIFDETQESRLKKGESMNQLFLLPCSKVLSNCAFDGRSFDCCRASQLMAVLTTSCQEISVSVK